MAKTIKSLENETFVADARLGYVERILTGLGNGADWEYRGECIDAGVSPAHCICGHPIRWQFVIHRIRGKKDTAIVGSECVQHFMYLNPALYDSLAKAVEELKNRIAEEKKKLKDAMTDKEISQLKEQYTPIFTELKATLDKLEEKWEGIYWWDYKDYSARIELASFLSKNSLECHKAYKHKSGVKNYYKNAIKNSEKLLKKFDDVLSTPVPPAMEAKRRRYI